MEAWGLNNDSMTYDPWDYVHITTWNFLPFLLRRVGVAPRWVVNVAFVVWYAALAATAWVLWRLRKILRTGQFDSDAGAGFGGGQPTRRMSGASALGHSPLKWGCNPRL